MPCNVSDKILRKFSLAMRDGTESNQAGDPGRGVKVGMSRDD